MDYWKTLGTSATGEWRRRGKVALLHHCAPLRAHTVAQVQACAQSKLKFIWDTAGEESQGDAAVSGVRLKTLSPSEVQDMATDGVFLCTGHVPSTQFTQSDCSLRAMWR
ncbi:thioredoxin reductase [Deinococcus gobiensis]|uniref:Thioredoxin reductase n=1 Tax=Deinococcus gobiensis (strain DSM 21396 / JCM 16679 / CGMCC 1.7299 / I-0) TaxID=745776 RepID=H8H378_DEIGI|nr:thioredoxin reductase [Deinococcus gobiensis]AFD27975.1 Thioredoxin reductase [Deinococcus gobiensis I-0]